MINPVATRYKLHLYKGRRILMDICLQHPGFESGQPIFPQDYFQ